MAKATDLIFSPLNIASARELSYLLMDLPVVLFGCHSSLLTVKHVGLVVAHDGSFSQMEIVCIYHSIYFDYKGAFRTADD